MIRTDSSARISIAAAHLALLVFAALAGFMTVGCNTDPPGSGGENGAPVANAGEDFAAAVGSLVILDGGDSSDPDNDVLSYAWEATSIAPGSQLRNNDIEDSDTDLAYFVPDVAGTYTFQLTVSDDLLVSTDFVTVTASAVDLATPGNFIVSGHTSSSITVSWVSVADADGYRLYRDSSSAGVFANEIYNGLNTYYTDTSLQSGTTFYYKVCAANAYGSGPLSGAVSGTTDVAVPTAPASIRVTNQTHNSVYLDWDSVLGATSYQVYRDTGETGSFTTQVYTGSVSACEDDQDLTEYTGYWYKVQATNSAGSSVLTSAVFARTSHYFVGYTCNYYGRTATIFNGIHVLNGLVAPDRTVTRSVDNPPVDICVDWTRDKLYMSLSTPQSGIAVYDNAASVDGAVDPDRMITHPMLTSPKGLFVDTNADELYATYYDRVMVFADASTADGAQAPIRTVSSDAITNAYEIYLDVTNDRLYVANGGGADCTIAVFDNASSRNGTSTADRVLSYDVTASWNGICVDSERDVLYGAKGLSGIYVFDNASSISGDISPSAMLQFTGTDDLFLDEENDKIYAIGGSMGTESRIGVWDNASVPAGGTTPSRFITYSSDNDGPSGIWIAPQ